MSSDLAHERERVAVDIVKETHPQIVIGQLGDAVRRAHEHDASFTQGCMRGEQDRVRVFGQQLHALAGQRRCP